MFSFAVRLKWNEINKIWIKPTDTFREWFVPLSSRLTAQDRWSKQVVSGVTVVENNRAKGKVPVFYFTLPDGVGWDSWIRAIDHYTERETQWDTNTHTEQNKEKHVLFGINLRGSFLSPLVLFSGVFHQDHGFLWILQDMMRRWWWRGVNLQRLVLKKG